MKLDRSTWRAMAVATQIGTGVTVSLAIAMGGGFLLDRLLGTKPVFLLLGVVVGVLAAVRTIADLAKQVGDSPVRRDRES